MVNTKKISQTPEALALRNFPPGHKIGGYTLKSFRGKGGMGVVYEAERNNRTVALKIFPREYKKHKFFRECRIHAELTHPNIATFFDAGGYEGRSYIVMEFVDGKDLYELVKEKKVTSLDTLKICSDIALTLHQIHEKGYIHRDVKPENIMVTKEGRTKLIDFGITIHKDDKANQDSGYLTGTKLFISPEQLSGVRLDHRTDLYSLGRTLYVCFEAEGAEEDLPPMDTEKILTMVHKPPSVLCGDIDLFWNDAILRLLQRDREVRTQTAYLAYRELTRILEHAQKELSLSPSLETLCGA